MMTPDWFILNKYYQGIVSRKRGNMSKIGIIGAMELEVEALKTDMEVSRIVKKANMDFYE